MIPPSAITLYHPLFGFNQFGGLERCALRPGNVHSADGWRAVLEPVVEVAVPRDLFGRALALIDSLRPREPGPC